MDGKEIKMDDGVTFTLSVCDFISRSERVPKDDIEVFNNLYVKNFPSQDYTE